MKHQQIVSDILNAAFPIRMKYRELHPEWENQDSPLKYVSHAMDDTIQKSFIAAGLAASYFPQRVVELGPGTGYLMYTLSSLYGISVYGLNIREPLYFDMYQRLEIVVDELDITPDMDCNAHRGTDMFIATQICWMNNWSHGDLHEFVLNLLDALNPCGRIILFPNPGACDCDFDLFDINRTAVSLPLLGDGYIIPKQQ